MTGWPCPACGTPLGFRPWEGELPADEICPCCQIQFGYEDAFPDDPARRVAVYRAWRARWVAEGCPWRSRARPEPPDFDPRRQLARLPTGR